MSAINNSAGHANISRIFGRPYCGIVWPDLALFIGELLPFGVFIYTFQSFEYVHGIRPLWLEKVSTEGIIQAMRLMTPTDELQCQEEKKT
jgi:hypothetical protein